MVYLTNEGVRRLYDQGLKDKITYFSINDDDINYQIYSGLTYNKDALAGDVYYSGTTLVTVPTPRMATLRGLIDKGTFGKKELLEIQLDQLMNTSLYEPAIQTTSNVILPYKNSNGLKYFNSDLVLGENNAWIKNLIPATGNTAAGMLKFETPPIKPRGYVSNDEPSFIQIPQSGDTPFPGVSVTYKPRSKTDIEYIHLINHNPNPIYFKDIVVSKISSTIHNVQKTYYNTGRTDGLVEIIFIIYWTYDQKNFYEGKLKVLINEALFTGEKDIIYPYEVVTLGISYEVLFPGSSVKHYHGQTLSDPTIKEGVLEFTLNMNAYNIRNHRNNDAEYLVTSNDINVIVQLKKTIYVETEFEEPVEVSDLKDKSFEPL